MARVIEVVEESDDNRDRLQLFFRQQGNATARNEAVRLNTNFDYGEAAADATPEAGKPVEKFDAEWFAGGARRGLQVAEPLAAQPEAEGKGKQILSRSRVQDEKRQLTEESNEQQWADDTAQQVFQNAPSSESLRKSGEAEMDRDQAADTAGTLGRAYVDKIERQVQQQVAPAPQQAQAQTGFDMQLSSHAADSARHDWDLADGMSVTGSPAAGGRLGLTSLEFELPQRGTPYYFTTPRGNVTLAARPLDTRITHRVTSILGLAAVAAGAWLLWRFARRMTSSRRRRVVAGVLVCLAGVLLLLLVGLPVYGLALVLGGVLVMLGQNSPRRPDAALV
jgi:hypothetical protein